ncbi:MAG: hypothetical protein KFH87_12000 [Bacteroidetes bacterium]|nr:hypothetical protein [Bacteroidota bacterium]
MYYYITRIAIIIVSVCAFFLLTAGVGDSVQRMLRGHDLLSNIYQQIIGEYVEEVEPDDLLEAAVSGMLSELDPYGEFIKERANSEVDVLAHGVYNGLGIKVKQRNGQHIVSYVYDDIRPLTSLRIGDVLLRIEDTDLRESAITDLRPLLRGMPGSNVHLLVRRPGSDDSLKLYVLRRAVSVDPLPYQAELEEGIFYMKLTRFTKSAADSLRLALQRAYALRQPKGIILDLRDNPGGLLESAVALVDYFVPVGTPIVSMQGRQASYTRRYAARIKPVSEDVPIAVLINGRSASASEIAAGALQDLDRAVIIGERTFGKGLVQTLIPLNYNAFLKLTTSRYYIPSGRCIQRLNYANNGKPETRDEKNAVFKTLRLSRSVRESNGIFPDILITQDSLPPFLAYLRTKDAVFDFVVWYCNAHHPDIAPSIDERIRLLFQAHVDTLGFTEDYPLGEALRTLKREADRAGAERSMLRRIGQIEMDITRHTARKFDLYWDQIRSLLEEEFVFQLQNNKMRIARMLRNDDAVRRAVEVLESKASWEAALLQTASAMQSLDE